MSDELRRNIVGVVEKKEMWRTDSSNSMLGQKVDHEGKEYQNGINFMGKPRLAWNCRVLFLRTGFRGILKAIDCPDHNCQDYSSIFYLRIAWTSFGKNCALHDSLAHCFPLHSPAVVHNQ